MQPLKIYIDQQIADSPITESIMSRFKCPSLIVANVKEVYSYIAQADRGGRASVRINEAEN